MLDTQSDFVGACPADDVLTHFVDGALLGTEAYAVARHVAECETCDGIVRILQGRESVRQGFADALLRDSMPGSLPETRRANGVWPGEVLGGRYRIERILGRGGMGIVVAARDNQSGAQVAIKVVSHEAAQDREMVQRLRREARVMQQLRSAAIVRAHEVVTDEALPFLVMEYLEGVDLEHHVLAHGRQPVMQVVSWGLTICEALGEAHSLGIIHRDLKLQNLFLARGPDGREHVKVLDFGIARGASGPESLRHPLTSSQVILGTPHYMAPEQFHNPRDAEPRSDVWSLGVCLYRLLTAEYPFFGKSVAAVSNRILSEEPVPVLQRRPEMPPMLAQLVTRCLQKTASERPASMGHVAATLRMIATVSESPTTTPIRSPVHVALASAPVTPAHDEATLPAALDAPSLPLPNLAPEPDTQGARGTEVMVAHRGVHVAAAAAPVAGGLSRPPPQPPHVSAPRASRRLAWSLLALLVMIACFAAGVTLATYLQR
jgi:serine/threonine-protein kinase